MKVSGIKKITYIALSCIMLFILVPVSVKAEYKQSFSCYACNRSFYVYFNDDGTFNRIDDSFHTLKSFTQPTCDTYGTISYMCLYRNTLQTYPRVRMLDHNYSLVSETASDYKHEGSEIYECSRCGNRLTRTLPKLPCPGHEFIEEVTLSPTYDSTGEKKYTCSICDYTYTDSIPKLYYEDGYYLEAIFNSLENLRSDTALHNATVDNRLANIEEYAQNISVSYNGINCNNGNDYSEKLDSLIDSNILIQSKQNEINDFTKSVSENTAELVRLQTNDINNEDMLNQLSGNIEKLNTRLTELSTYLGYFFAFLIFIMIVIIFKGCWKLIDKYLLNVTLR